MYLKPKLIHLFYFTIVMKQRKVRHSSNRKIRAMFARARVHVDRVSVSDIVATVSIIDSVNL